MKEFENLIKAIIKKQDTVLHIGELAASPRLLMRLKPAWMLRQYQWEHLYRYLKKCHLLDEFALAVEEYVNRQHDEAFNDMIKIILEYYPVLILGPRKLARTERLELACGGMRCWLRIIDDVLDIESLLLIKDLTIELKEPYSIRIPTLLRNELKEAWPHIAAEIIREKIMI